VVQWWKARRYKMKSDFMLAINQLCAERKLSREVVVEAVEAALISAYKRNFGSATNIEARVEPNTGDVRVYAVKEVVETVQDPKTQVSLEEARREEPEAQLGQAVMIESTPRDFGRIAAQTAKQVILQRIREAERDALYTTLADKAGEIALGTIQSVEYPAGDAIVNVEGAEAVLPVREQVSGERYRRGGRLRAYVLDVRRGNRGPQITLSRRSPALLRRLLELEVPEIFNGTVEVKAIAREAGSRSKVAVHATREGVDPVGSCVGVRGGRIQSVVNELGGEKIDVVQWDSDMAIFIANALSPAKVMNVLLDDDPETGKTATVIVPDRQLSLAIGKEGQNARLAAKLTGWRIDIKSATETAEETLGRLEQPTLAPEEMDLLTLAETILHERESVEISELERTVVDAQMQQERGLEQTRPEEEPALEGEPSPLPVGISTVASVDSAGLPAEALPEGLLSSAPELEGVVAEVEEMAGVVGDTPVAEDTAVVAEPLEVDSRSQEVIELTGGAPAELEGGDEAELIPSFEGEPVEDSLGWVVTEPPQEYQYDWEEDLSEETEATWETGWEKEELSEEEEFVRPQKKKRKKKGRQRTDYKDEQDFDVRTW
jgi:N utilization substance protein A